MKGYLILADGFEEMEAVYTISILRELGVELETISISDSLEVASSHNVVLFADALWNERDIYDGDFLVLPGGQPGTNNLKMFVPLKDVILYYMNNRTIAAICAAPSILGELGILEGRRVACYPGYEESLTEATIVYEPVVVDNNLITSRGAGTAADFAFAIADRVVDKDKVERFKREYCGCNEPC